MSPDSEYLSRPAPLTVSVDCLAKRSGTDEFWKEHCAAVKLIRAEKKGDQKKQVSTNKLWRDKFDPFSRSARRILALGAR